MTKLDSSVVNRALSEPSLSCKARSTSGSVRRISVSDSCRKARKLRCMVELGVRARFEIDCGLADPAGDTRAPWTFAERRQSGKTIVGKYDLGEPVKGEVDMKFVTI